MPHSIFGEFAVRRRANLTSLQNIAENQLFELQVRMIELERQNEELRQAQIELQSSRDCYQDLYDVAPFGYLTLDAEARIAQINLRACALLGIARAEAQARPFGSFVDESHRERWQQLFASAMRHAAHPSCTLAFKPDTSPMRYGWLEYLHITDSARKNQLRIALIDVTEQRRAELALNARDAIQAETEHFSQSQAASQTIAALAHELNQPLNAITAYSGVAVRLLRSGRGNPGKLRQALKACAQQAIRAGSTVRELLAFLTPSALDMAPLDLNNLVRSAVDRVKAEGLADFMAELRLEPALPLVSANRIQIENVLMNLIRNGIEAMQESRMPGQAKIEVQTRSLPGMAQATIGDKGPGIDPDTLSRIFDPFFSTKANGIGVGLSISRDIVKMHGGRLWAESKEGEGTHFHFTLPIAT